MQQTWDDGYLDQNIENVFKRLHKVLVLIVEGNGSNDLVESKRGVKNKNIKLPDTLANDHSPEATTSDINILPLFFDLEGDLEDEANEENEFEGMGV